MTQLLPILDFCVWYVINGWVGLFNQLTHQTQLCLWLPNAILLWFLYSSCYYFILNLSLSRAKYASTELGIRERLFVSVFTSKTTISTLAVAMNRTLNHHLDGRLIFFTGTRNRKLPNGLFVVAHGDERPVPNMFQSVRYLLEQHIADYNWFFFVQDDTYTQPERLKTLVSHLSLDLQLYMGHPGEFIGGETQGRYCHSGPGFLLSRALLLKLQPFLEQCRTDIVSIRPDEWLGRCIIDYAGMSCVEEYEVRGND